MNAVTHSSRISEHLVFRAGTAVCALPVASVEETLRPLPTSRVAGELPFLVGVAILRGQPTPVVDLSRLLIGREAERAGRWISVRVGDRRLALAVDEVIGVRSFDETDLEVLPNLLRGEVGAHVEALSARDGDLLFVLRASHILPEDAWPNGPGDGPGVA